MKLNLLNFSTFAIKLEYSAMLKWIVIGLILWYLYRRRSSRKQVPGKQDPRNINQGRYHRNYRKPRQDVFADEDGDYIDYEELE